MKLESPVSIYNAANNLDAHLICNMLNQAGVEAYAVEDVSTAGLFSLGTLAEIHKPQIWVSQKDADRAKNLIADFCLDEPDHRPSLNEELFCYHCGEPAAAGATICSSCGRRIEASDESDKDDEDESANAVKSPHDQSDDDDPDDTANLDRLRAMKRPIAMLMLGPIVFALGLFVLGILGMLLSWISRRP